MQLTLGEIAQVLESSPPASNELSVSGYSIDSRTVRPGELFFAIRGDRFDGHEFVLSALDRGAAAAVVEISQRGNFPQTAQAKLLAVPQVLEALQKLASSVRRRWGGPLVAVTGSTGKTTTRHMIASLLSTRFRVLESERNLNNHLGLPLSLLRLEPETEMGVFEMGMSAPGEIGLLARIAAPDVGVVTNVSAAHLGYFPDIEAIARAKYELIEELAPGSWAVLNADDPWVRSFGETRADRVLYFGAYPGAHFQAQQLEQDSSGGAAFTVPSKPYQGVPPGQARHGMVTDQKSGHGPMGDVRFQLPLLGYHNVMNALAALAVCYAMGIAPGFLQDAVAALEPVSMRGEIVRLANGVTIVNDCYNSSPQALAAMLIAVSSFPARRRFAVLGGMMELGNASEALHQAEGRRVAELGFNGLFTVGEDARHFAEGAQAAGMQPEALKHFDTPEEASDRLREMLEVGDVVLLKASRAIHLERVWGQLGPRAAAVPKGPARSSS